MSRNYYPNRRPMPFQNDGQLFFQEENSASYQNSDWNEQISQLQRYMDQTSSRNVPRSRVQRQMSSQATNSMNSPTISICYSYEDIANGQHHYGSFGLQIDSNSQQDFNQGNFQDESQISVNHQDLYQQPEPSQSEASYQNDSVNQLQVASHSQENIQSALGSVNFRINHHFEDQFSNFESQNQSQMIQQIVQRINQPSFLVRRKQRTEGLKMSQVLAYPLMVWNQNHRKYDPQQQCSFCLQIYDLGHSLRVLSCTHRFHKDCVDQWLSKKSSCPLCKNDLKKDRIDKNS